jgi:hypothetical protein
MSTLSVNTIQPYSGTTVTIAGLTLSGSVNVTGSFTGSFTGSLLGTASYADNATSASTFMIFRSYLTSFNDSITSDWNNFKYVGRGENLYTYSGFGRSVTIGFKVAALSDMEMQPMYQKLNQLISQVYPDYSPEYNLMRGNVDRKFSQQHRRSIGNKSDSITWFDKATGGK